MRISIKLETKIYNKYILPVTRKISKRIGTKVEDFKMDRAGHVARNQGKWTGNITRWTSWGEKSSVGRQ